VRLCLNVVPELVRVAGPMGKSTIPPPEFRAQMPAGEAETVDVEAMLTVAVTEVPLVVAANPVAVKVVAAAAGEVPSTTDMPMAAARTAAQVRTGRRVKRPIRVLSKDVNAAVNLRIRPK
jgi:hypothetical protein